MSPGNNKHEMDTKFSLYEEAGVKEYWIIQPNKTILIYILEKGKYLGLKPITEGEIAQSVLFADLAIDTNELFEH